ATQVNAQHCATASGTGVCTPYPGLTQVGFYPDYNNLPCAVDGVLYDTVISFHAPSSQSGATIDDIQVTEVQNLPCGICWAMGDPNNKVTGGSSGCLRVKGTTYDAAGQYFITVYANVHAHLSIIPVTLTGVNIDSLAGLKYYARVRVPNGPCTN